MALFKSLYVLVLTFQLLLLLISQSTVLGRKTTTLVVGATGATGKHVVQMLLDKGQSVRVIVRNKQRMLDLLQRNDNDYDDQLIIKEASLLDLSDEELSEQVKDCQAVVSCLGHNMNLKGIFWEQPLVTEAVKRLSSAIITSANNKQTTKFILMGSDGVANPNGQDDQRPFSERAVLTALRYLIPPHADNEDAAAYVYHNLGPSSMIEWTVVRPTDLVDGDASEYYVHYKPKGSLFGGEGIPATRANVAKFMVDLLTNSKLWEEWKFKMPTLRDQSAPHATSDEL